MGIAIEDAYNVQLAKHPTANPTHIDIVRSVQWKTKKKLRGVSTNTNTPGQRKKVTKNLVV